MSISFAEILEREAADTKSRLLAKVPQWRDAADRLEIPTRLSTEQCSSAPTALYKAALAQKLVTRFRNASSPDDGPHNPDLQETLRPDYVLNQGGTFRIADLTGGLGVDSWAFSQVASEVLYNEMNSELAEAVKHNFSILGISGVIFRSHILIPHEGYRSPSRSAADSNPVQLSEYTITEVLGDFKPDVVFLDPARRSDTGRKVFRLEDCSPDITALKDELLTECPTILLKLSPMADITMICRQLDPCIREIHILGLGGECKELLAVLHKPDGSDYSNIRIIVAELSGDTPVTLTFTPEEIAAAKPSLPSCDIFEKALLFEPGAALLKAGCFNLLSERFGLVKLGRSTHLYMVTEGNSCINVLSSFGKFFTVKEVLPFDKRSIRYIAARYPQCDVTARNLPVTSDELRKRIVQGGKRTSGNSLTPSSDNVHIFGIEVNYSSAPSSNLMLVTQGQIIQH